MASIAVACDGPNADREPGTAPVQHAAPPARIEAQVYFTRDESQYAVTRTVSADAPLRGALEALLAGPTAEERQAGLHSWFSEETAGMLRGVILDEAGRVVIDFEDLRTVIPNASTSAGSAMLLGELNRTVFQFPVVSAVEYRVEGSCDAFWNWIQRDCAEVQRSDLEF